MDRASIVRELAPANVAQPATVLWRAYEIEAVRDHVPFDGRVLDLGCGDGSLSAVVFARTHAELIGLDPDPADVRAARASGLYSETHVAPGDRIPEPDGSFDMVFSNSVLEHIPTVEPVLAEAARVLRPGGRFVFTVPSERFHECLEETWFGRLTARRGLSERDAIDQRLAHHRYWGPERWRSELAGVGLAVISHRRYLPAAAIRRWQRLSNWTGGLAFELMGGRSSTRTIQRRSGLLSLGSRVPPKLAEKILEWILGPALRHSIEEGGAEPSAGLLIVSER